MEIDLLLAWRKKMSNFNFISESDDRILEYLGPIRMEPVSFKRELETGEWRLVPTDGYIYACVSGP